MPRRYPKGPLIISQTIDEKHPRTCWKQSIQCERLLYDVNFGFRSECCCRVEIFQIFLLTLRFCLFVHSIQPTNFSTYRGTFISFSCLIKHSFRFFDSLICSLAQWQSKRSIEVFFWEIIDHSLQNFQLQNI